VLRVIVCEIVGISLRRWCLVDDGLPGSRFEMSRGSDDAQPDGKS
jgi:hypothetical protein